MTIFKILNTQIGRLFHLTAVEHQQSIRKELSNLRLFSRATESVKLTNFYEFDTLILKLK